MSADRFARLKEILLKAADLSVVERELYLDEACEDDPELRKEAESILAHEADPPGILKTGGGGPAATPEETPTVTRTQPSPLPRQIAGYRIVRKLGEGGMGVVYEAEQQSPRRPVALKIVRGGAYVDEHRVRLFQREAQTLGRLKHPSIAAIYEAGRTEDGQHFFAMELVRGVPLDEYLENRPLKPESRKADLRTRLGLFQQICDAINYAHQRGIIHRDLKPSNILVLPGKASRSGSSGEQTQIKILDFGLARMTDTDVTMTTVATEAGLIQGTLAYMSPEQARGNPDEIDLRSDVYSLGVILYELLTEQPPYDVRKTLIPEAVRVICEEAPRRPSAITKTLRGDLETIALKALEKEPARRFQSAAALADDIERYLSDLPILARPPSAAYQLRKLVARHRGGVIFAGSVIALLLVLGAILAAFGFMAVLVVILVAFGITMSVMFGAQRAERMRADRQRDRAEVALATAEEERARAVREAEKANQVSQFVREMLGSHNPLGGNYTVSTAEEKDFARRLLDRAAERVEKELADQPEVLAEIHDVLGITYWGLAFFDSAKIHLQSSLALRRGLFGNQHPDVAATLCHLGMAIGEFEVSEYEEAKSYYDEALEIQRAVLGEKHPDTAKTLLHRGRIEAIYSLEFRKERHELVEAVDDEVPSYPGSLELSERWVRQSLDIQREIGDLGGFDGIGTCLMVLGQVNRLRGDFERAVALGLESVAARSAREGPDHYLVSYDLMFLGESYLAAGDHAAAEPALRRALAIRERVLPAPRYYIHNQKILGDCLFEQGKFASADSLYSQTLPLYRETYPTSRRTLCNIPVALAICRRRQGDSAGAGAVIRDALDWARTTHGDGSPEAASLLQYTASNYYGAEALPHLLEALGSLRSILDDDDPSTASGLRVIGYALWQQNRLDDALSYLLQAVEIQRRLTDEDDAETFRVLATLGWVLMDTGRFEEARPYVTHAFEGRKELLGDKHPRTLLSLTAMGWLKLQTGHAEEAVALLEPQEPLMREALAATPAWLGTYLTTLGASRVATRAFEPGEARLLEGEEMLVGLRPSERRRVLRELVGLYEAWDAAEPGEGHDRRAMEWRAKLGDVLSTTAANKSG